MKVNALIIVLCCFGVTYTVSSQNSIVAAGVKATGSGGTVSYSVGPIIFKKPDGTSATNGIQQPYEILTLGTADYTGASVQLSFYPNPTEAFLHLVVNQMTKDDYEYQVLSLEGKEIVTTQKITSEETLVDLGINPSGVYILTVSSNHQIIKSFKIIKH